MSQLIGFIKDTADFKENFRCIPESLLGSGRKSCRTGNVEVRVTGLISGSFDEGLVLEGLLVPTLEMIGIFKVRP